MKNGKKRMLQGLMILGLVMLSEVTYANLSDKFSEYVDSDIESANSLYIIVGVIAAGVIGKICQHYFMGEETKPVSKARVNSQYNQRQRHIIKKTA